MKTIKALSLVVITSVSVQALAQTPPPPLKPVEYLDPDSVRTTPASTPAPTPKPVATPVATPKPVATPAPTAAPVATPKPVVVAQPTATPKPVPSPTAAPKPTATPKPTPKPTPAPSKPTPKPAPPTYQPPTTGRPASTPPPTYDPNPSYGSTTTVRGFRVGDQVATENHYIGTIQVLYRNESADVRFSNGQTNNWPLSRLIKVVQSLRGFTTGQAVHTDQHYKGVIQTLFSDETADIRFTNGQVNNWPLSRISREISQLRGFYKGQSVITDTKYKGVIVDIFADETADVRFRDGTNNWPLSRLGKEISSLGQFTVGQTVITDSHYTGVIVEIFSDETANVRFRDGTNNWPISRLGKVLNSLGGFTVGQTVVTDSHYTGQIVEIFADATANVRFRDGTNNWPISRLGKVLNSLGGFTVGQTVVTDSHYTGQIVEIYSDQTANVRFRDGTNNWPLSRLGRVLQSYQGFSVGQRVATDTNWSGVIEQIFSDGTANVRFREGMNNWPLSRLSGAYCSPSVCPR